MMRILLASALLVAFPATALAQNVTSTAPAFYDEKPNNCGPPIASDGMQNPNSRWVVTCTYPDGVIATFRSAADPSLQNYKTDTDWILLGWNTGCNSRTGCTGTPQTTPEGQAYLGEPATAAGVAAAKPRPALTGPVFNDQTPSACYRNPPGPNTAPGKYLCTYPDGTSTVWQSASDWTLLSSRSADDVQYTDAGVADNCDQPDGCFYDLGPVHGFPATPP